MNRPIASRAWTLLVAVGGLGVLAAATPPVPPPTAARVHASQLDSAGAYTAAQAARGEAVYARHCAQCHAVNLGGGTAPPLAGAAFRAKWSAPELTVDDLLYVTRTTMPFTAAGTLPRAEYLDVVAYLLQRNGHPAGPRELVAERAQLRALRVIPPTPPPP